MKNRWNIWIDTGGTFTDCVAINPQGDRQTVKVLSSGELRARVVDSPTQGRLRLATTWRALDGLLVGFQVQRPGAPDGPRVSAHVHHEGLAEIAIGDESTGFEVGETVCLRTGEEAPILAARLVTGTPLDRRLPPIDMRLATTRGTNALLEGTARRPALFVTAGFADLLLIGDQARPDLFTLRIEKPPPQYSCVVEVRERLDASGRIIETLDLARLRHDAVRVLASGVREAAIALLHSHRNPEHEAAAACVLKEAGFEHVTCSSRISPLIRIVPRAETSIVNAAVSSVLESYFQRVESAIGDAPLRIMSSAGGLRRAGEAHPKDCLLSGPAGGVIGAVQSAAFAGFQKVIGFDMGGTSTDVCRFDGALEYRYEHRVGGARVQAPALAIETVAAGGGSICSYVHGRLRVGPESAGATPGPACYGAGGPLTITDVNLLLGRLDPDRFEIPLNRNASTVALQRVLDTMAAAGEPVTDATALLQGFLAIADERMAEAIARISIRRGFDLKEFALVSFGGAGGQHACRIASLLGLTTVLMPHDASALSAVGLGAASIEHVAQRQVLQTLDEIGCHFEAIREALMAESREALAREGVDSTAGVAHRCLVEARLLGQDSTLSLDVHDRSEIALKFAAAYRAMYGHDPEERPVEIESVRIIASVTGRGRDHDPPPSLAGTWTGPHAIHVHGSTFIIEAGWIARSHPSGCVVATRIGGDVPKAPERPWVAERDLFMNRFSGIAEEMGETLRRTALSTNVKERLDFSCALLDPAGRLLVNAPHIPVHLGSLGICVRAVVQALDLKAGDVAMTNHPAFGGSHLPDLTVITPAFDDRGVLLGYAANRAHHAEIGGSRPGSMPADATSLEEEGVIIAPMLLARDGMSRFDTIERELRSARYPSRAIEDNLADLRAAVAANNRGVQSLRTLARAHGTERVLRQMEAVHDHAARAASQAITAMPDGVMQAADTLDDGSPVQVRVVKAGDTLLFDFTGSAPVHPGNLNATPAIVTSAVLYVLRTLIGEALPLNEGILRGVTISIPTGLLNPPFPLDGSRLPAVVGGNTEVSQRVVDVLLKAFGACAASQGTMNNLLFGNDRFGYYETICGGSGAGPGFHGADAVHTHMTNTRLTDPEVLEHRYPVRLRRFAIRRGSGGAGRWRGGEGIVRELEFLAPMKLTLLSQRRQTRPFGMAGGVSGLAGLQRLARGDGSVEVLGPVIGAEVRKGDVLTIETPGGGGWGAPEP